MKRLLIALILVAMLCITGSAWGASSATESWSAIGSEIDIVTISWTAHTDGTFTSYAISGSPWLYSGAVVKGCLFYAITNPGSPAPTANYDITVLNSDGIDIAGSQLLNRHTTTSEDVKFTTARCINGTVTIAIANNSQASAQGTITLFFGGGR